MKMTPVFAAPELAFAQSSSSSGSRQASTSPQLPPCALPGWVLQAGSAEAWTARGDSVRVLLGGVAHFGLRAPAADAAELAQFSEELQHGGRIGCEDPADAHLARTRIFHDGRGSSCLVLPLTVRVPPAAAH